MSQITLKPENGIKEDDFDEDLIRKYPRANKKISVEVSTYGLESDDDCKSQTMYISPHGMEFKTTEEFACGTLLKIQVALPDYWRRKQQFVDYNRIDTPDQFRVLAKVVKTEDIGKRGKRKMVVAQTLIMDEVDEKVLKGFLQEGS